MPGQTLHGYPYPLGTDRVMDGDDAIKALADKVEAFLLGGVASGQAVVQTSTAANTPVAVTVTFPAGRFSAPPWVVAQTTNNAPHQFNCSVYTTTATSVILYGTRNVATGSYSLGINWIAHLP